ncbi:MAG: polysaccharide deacetylase family protein [Deltaproteobacteria bacterium]|nr:polysaccharide deacetylase family protein [Deltaproteobacteria bacterium]MBW2360251.1 polysaccharide deacetylase family protein [Deltaproteobacteria bacterium]
MSRLAQRLGFSAADRIAIVHADDIGCCHAANVGAFEALDAGPATCGSVMVPCPWFAEAAGYARERPGVDLGVHLTLNCEYAHYRWGPVVGAAAVPSLVDPDGAFPQTVATLVERARPDEVERELRAQIEGALAAGIDVTHLDAHMGAVMLPPFVDIYGRLALEFRLPLFVVRPDEAVLRALGAEASVPVYRRAIERLEAVGIPILDGFDDRSLHFEPGGGEAHNRARLAKLGTGVSYLICHPARGGEELDAISDTAHMREFERTFYGGESGRRALAEAGLRTVGMRALRELVRAG